MDEQKPLLSYRITIPLTDEAAEWIAKQATAEQRTMTQMTRIVLLEGIEARRERERKNNDGGT
jgi:hypothetical protein